MVTLPPLESMATIAHFHAPLGDTLTLQALMEDPIAGRAGLSVGRFGLRMAVTFELLTHCLTDDSSSRFRNCRRFRNRRFHFFVKYEKVKANYNFYFVFIDHGSNFEPLTTTPILNFEPDSSSIWISQNPTQPNPTQPTQPNGLLELVYEFHPEFPDPTSLTPHAASILALHTLVFSLRITGNRLSLPPPPLYAVPLPSTLVITNTCSLSRIKSETCYNKTEIASSNWAKRSEGSRRLIFSLEDVWRLWMASLRVL
ncbi:hypothetical protein PHJA_000831700 [Phtheirospermum japonicum]|uniref:Uncharacterized protein n=1 Tax=Phtheirospermum japonicum TaxID=374723 RepID=A0A830BMU4_9LAMI|nr:hypothetical protein PHJA_000831700 [Phtheirospermum japonicum]